VADADGLNRAEISSQGDGVHPTSNYVAQWRPRAAAVSLNAPPVSGDVGDAVEVTVTASADCPHGGVIVIDTNVSASRGQPQVMQ